MSSRFVEITKVGNEYQVDTNAMVGAGTAYQWGGNSKYVTSFLDIPSSPAVKPSTINHLGFKSDGSFVKEVINVDDYSKISDNQFDITLLKDIGNVWKNTGVSVSGLKSVASSASIAVAVGENGKLYTSVNGKTWTDRSSSSLGTMFSVVYAPDKELFVAVGNYKSITSSDGITWSTSPELPQSAEFVTYVPSLGKFLATCAYGYILSSSDGVSWTSVSTGISARLKSIAYSESLGMYVVVGHGDWDSYLLTSSDFTSWTEQTVTLTTDAKLKSVCYSDELSMFVAVGTNNAIITSSNGTTWNLVTLVIPSGLTFNTVIYSSLLNAFFATGSIQASSSDGVNWSNNYSSDGNTYIEHLCEFKSSFVGVAPYDGLRVSDGVITYIRVEGSEFTLW